MKVTSVLGCLKRPSTTTEIALSINREKNKDSLREVKKHLDTLADIVEKKPKLVLNKSGREKLNRLIKNSLSSGLIRKGAPEWNGKIGEFAETIEDEINYLWSGDYDESVIKNISNKLSHASGEFVSIFSDDFWSGIKRIIRNPKNISKSGKEIDYEIDRNRLFDLFINESKFKEYRKTLDTDEFRWFLVDWVIDRLKRTTFNKEHLIELLGGCFSGCHKDVDMSQFLKKKYDIEIDLSNEKKTLIEYLLWHKIT